MANISARRLDRKRFDWVGVTLVGVFLLALGGMTCYSLLQSRKDKLLLEAVQTSDMAQVKSLIAANHYSKKTLNDAFDNLSYQPPGKEKMALLQLLMDSGANPNVQSGLEHAAQAGDNAMVKLMLARGADPNKRQGYYSALMFALTGNHIETAHLLLDKGANPNDEGGGPDTTLMTALNYGHNDLALILLDKGANPNKTGTGGQHPLEAAALKGRADVTKKLLEKGATVEAKDIAGRTALSFAAEQGNVQVCRILLDHGADINAADKSASILGYAVMSGKPKAVRRRLDRGAKPDKNGSLLSYAKSKKRPDIIKMLEDAGAK